MNRNVNQVIAKRREQLGLTDTYISYQIGVNIDSYCDIEWYEDEIFEVVPMGSIKDLCKVLSLDFFELFGIECAFCKLGMKYNQDYLLPRNQLVQKRREQLQLSREELSDKIGFYEIAIKSMEEYENYLDTWVLVNIVELGDILKIPLQILIGSKCPHCNR